NAVSDPNRSYRTCMRKSSIVAMGLMFAASTLPAAGQALRSTATLGKSDIATIKAVSAVARLCTAGNNAIYGWYELGDGWQGVSTPGNTACLADVPNSLKVDVGGLKLPLAALPNEGIY